MGAGECLAGRCFILNVCCTHDSVPVVLGMNDLSAINTFVIAIENANIVAVNCQKIVTTSPIM